MNKIIWFVFFTLMLSPGWALGKEPLTDAELDGTTAMTGFVLELYGDKILDKQNLSPEETEKMWREMTPAERDVARKNFRQALIEMEPEERAEIRQQMLNRFVSLSPEEQESTRNQIRSRMQGMSPAEQSEYMDFREKMLQDTDVMPGNRMFPGMFRGPNQ